MIAELVARQLCWRLIFADGSRFDHCHTLLVIHQMQRLALESNSLAIAAVLAVDLEVAQVDSLVAAT